MRQRHVIRLATNADGPAIGRLVVDAGWTIDGLDWSSVAPFWIVGELEGRIAGCIQVAFSKPIGYLEMLAVESTLDGFARHALVQDLLIGGFAAHAKMGCQMVCGVIPFDMKDYKRALKKRGGVVVACGNVIAKRLPRAS